MFDVDIVEVTLFLLNQPYQIISDSNYRIISRNGFNDLSGVSLDTQFNVGSVFNHFQAFQNTPKLNIQSTTSSQTFGLTLYPVASTVAKDASVTCFRVFQTASLVLRVSQSSSGGSYFM